MLPFGIVLTMHPCCCVSTVLYVVIEDLMEEESRLYSEPLLYIVCPGKLIRDADEVEHIMRLASDGEREYCVENRVLSKYNLFFNVEFILDLLCSGRFDMHMLNISSMCSVLIHRCIQLMNICMNV